jgi:5-methylcytosine-specific restriction protein A
MLQRRDQKTADGNKTGQAMEDTRSVKQMQADALTFLATHSLGCDEIPTRPTTTLVLRMTLAELEAGLGHATIDGINQPVSAGTVRRMAADAQVIPCVLGGDSEILDWGRARRLFSVPQKLASGERDGGCSGCGLPASMTIMHHIQWWWRDHGCTDLTNGVLLCVSCHHRVHDEGWEIRIEGAGVNAKVWFIPPASVDPDRTPRLGGRARYDLTA